MLINFFFRGKCPWQHRNLPLQFIFEFESTKYFHFFFGSYLNDFVISFLFVVVFGLLLLLFYSFRARNRRKYKGVWCWWFSLCLDAIAFTFNDVHIRMNSFLWPVNIQLFTDTFFFRSFVRLIYCNIMSRIWTETLKQLKMQKKKQSWELG